MQVILVAQQEMTYLFARARYTFCPGQRNITEATISKYTNDTEIV